MNLEDMKVGEEVSLPLDKLSEAHKAVQIMTMSTPAKLFTVREMDSAVFKIKRLR